jgi:hypothetical protein
LEEENQENGALKSKITLLSEENERIMSELQIYTEFFGSNVLNRVKGEKSLKLKVEKMQRQQEQFIKDKQQQ